MKLTKTSLIVFTSGILVIALAGLGMAYSRQSSDQSQLNQELAQAQLILDKAASDELLTQKDELDKRLTEGQSQIQILKIRLSPELQSIESSDDLFITAEKCDVEIMSIRSTPPESKKLNGLDYSALEFRVRLEGEVADIIRFIHMWTEEHPTGLVQTVRIVIPEVGDDEEEDEGDIEDEDEGDVEDEDEGDIEDEDELKPSAEIELIIYTYLGG
ncbi:hypothetical protein ACFLRP_04890 [Bacteroidota bacterium]